jgi:acid phosphatase type 7
MKKIKIFRAFFYSGFLLLAFQFAAAQSYQPTSYPDRIIMNPRSDAERSVAITWRTDDQTTEGVLELQPSPAGPVDKTLSRVIRAKSTPVRYEYPDEPTISAMQHTCLLQNLNSGTKYMYRVGSGNFWSEWFEFSIDNNRNNKFSFTYLGDPQTDIRSQWSRVLRSAYLHNPGSAFILYAGDLINRAGRETEWQEWFEAGSFIYATVPQLMTPGNHDYRNQVLDSHWKYQFNLPDNGPEGLKHTCYFIDYKNLKLISIDSAADSELRDTSGTALETQKAWLDSILTMNTREWIILTTHLPFYSPKESRDNAHIRQAFQPIIEKHGVDMVLSGHDHSYGRGQSSDNPAVKNPIVYVVSVSGPKMYEVGDKEWMKVKGTDIQLYHEISIDDNRLTFKAFTADGRLFDQFVLKKKKNGISRLMEMKNPK